MSFFQELEEKLGQANPNEGSFWSSEDSELTVWPDPSDKVNIRRDDLAEPLRFQSINHVNAVCFHLWAPSDEMNRRLLANVDGETLTFQLPARLKCEFCDHLVAIRDAPDFRDRLERELKRQCVSGFIRHCKIHSVQYQDCQPQFLSSQGPLDAADFKGTMFRYQSECRVAFERRDAPRNGCACTLGIGDIGDIPLSMKTADIFNIQATRSP